MPGLVRDLTTREIFGAEVLEDPGSELVCVRLVGSGFMYNMVRLLVGAACAAGRGELEEGAFEEALAARHHVDLSRAIAPAHGLVLHAQRVDAELWYSMV